MSHKAPRMRAVQFRIEEDKFNLLNELLPHGWKATILPVLLDALITSMRTPEGNALIGKLMRGDTSLDAFISNAEHNG